MEGLAVLAGFSSATARADRFWITGAFGNEAGCRFVADSSARSDSLGILRSKSIERCETQCETLNTPSSGGGLAVLNVICGGEGETWADMFMFHEDVENHNRLRLTLTSAGESTELKRCE